MPHATTLPGELAFPPRMFTDRRAAGQLEVVCLHQPEDLYAIGLWYEDFRQVHDEEVVRILDGSRRSP